jgi:hypothetical protein
VPRDNPCGRTANPATHGDTFSPLDRLLQRLAADPQSAPETRTWAAKLLSGEDAALESVGEPARAVAPPAPKPAKRRSRAKGAGGFFPD